MKLCFLISGAAALIRAAITLTIPPHLHQGTDHGQAGPNQTDAVRTS